MKIGMVLMELWQTQKTLQTGIPLSSDGMLTFAAFAKAMQTWL